MGKLRSPLPEEGPGAEGVLYHVTKTHLLPVPCRPFIKLKENGRANISRSSSSTSSFSSTAGEGEAIEECDSGVGVPCPTWGWHSEVQETTLLYFKIALWARGSPGSCYHLLGALTEQGSLWA